MELFQKDLVPKTLKGLHWKPCTFAYTMSF